jgi:sortase A
MHRPSLFIGGAFLGVGVLLIGFVLLRALVYDPQADVPLTAAVTLASTTPVSPEEYPVRILIPAIKVDTAVEEAGIVAGGRMAAPAQFADAAWYKYGTVPGRVGSAIIEGHLDNGLGLDGAFRHLERLAPGDDIKVVTAGGQQLDFTVSALATYPYDALPDSFFTATDTARLNLITCAGRWIKLPEEGWTFDHRLVVYAVRNPSL